MHHLWCSGGVPEAGGGQTDPGTEKGPLLSEILPPNESLRASLGLRWGTFWLQVGPWRSLGAPSGYLMVPIRDPRAAKERTGRSQEAIWEP